MRAALVAEAVGKSFRHRSAEIAPTFRAWVESGMLRRRPDERFWALRDVSLTVAPGEMLGVIGRNGSGKSTLLRLLGGVMQPDTGRIAASDPARGLLQLNAGMHPDLSGRENILINGVLCGLLKADVLERLDDIVAFAGLRDHVDRPVRTYSSGMKLRLGFAIAVHLEPRILLIDEVLAVGDLAFQEKCLDRITAFRRDGCAIVLISHDMGQIRQFCDRAILLHAGRIVAEGEAGAVVDTYEAAAYAGALEGARAATASDLSGRFGRGEVVIDDVALTDRGGRALDSLSGGDGLVVRIRLSGTRPTPARVSVSIADAEGGLVFDANSETDGIDLPAISSGLEVSIDLERLDLAPGRYLLTVGAWREDWTDAYDVHKDAYAFEVAGGARLKGLLAPPRRWTVRPSD